MAPHPENLALARLALTGVGAVAGATDAAVAELKLAVTEACTNAILHGYSRAPEGELVVRYHGRHRSDRGRGRGRRRRLRPGGPARGLERRGSGDGPDDHPRDHERRPDRERRSGSRISFVRRLEV